MEDVRQGHVVDASLAYLQKLEDEMRGLNGTQLVSSDSSTLGSPSTRKRRRLESSSDGYGYGEASKKIRITTASQDRSRQLPAELWHNIFSFLSPAALGRCLRVNRMFHKYLDPVSPFVISVIHVPTTRMLPTLSPDAIWRASRCLHWPAMPAPLKGRFELDMWRLACTRSCQFCGQVDKAYNTTEDSSQPRRPGNTTVSPIFPFFINSCGNCLVRKSIKEVDFHLSSKPSFISPGLPMVFLTPDMNVISPQEMQSIPVAITAIQVTKVYWPAQVEKLQEEFEEVKRFGVAAVEEWKKGLDVRGIEKLHDASRWDRWLLTGGVRQMRRHSIQPTSTANKPEWIRRKGSEIAKTLQKQRQDVETTVRIHISNLADEVIRGWVKGRSVKKGNCADFAADVLAYVRKQFYKDGAKAASLTRGLTLDDMKWVFEHKIGPHTNNHQKDYFRCKECPGTKRYGFLAIIQHYAMKHGSKKSKSMSMLWRTEWPEEPPFRCSVEQKASVSSTPAMHQYSGGEGLVGSMYGVAEASASRPLETYYVRERREHASQREQSHDYQQPISSTTLYQSYGIVDVRNLPYGYYIQHPAILHNYSIPSNAGYSNYTIGESYRNTGALSRVYNVYESRDPLANRRSGGWE